ncbi:MAG: hypothetical protein Q7S89_01895 [bacterium]|nr:hypothetical protein [bacterium]
MEVLELPLLNDLVFKGRLLLATRYLGDGGLAQARQLIRLNDEQFVPEQYYEEIKRLLRSIVPISRGGDCRMAVYVSLAIKDLGMDPVELGTSQEEVKQLACRGYRQVIQDELEAYRRGMHMVLPILLAQIEQARRELHLSLEELGLTSVELNAMQRALS